MAPTHQDVDHLARRRVFQAEHVVDVDAAIHVFGAEAIRLGIEFRLLLALQHVQRIEMGGEVAANAIGPDHHQRADRVLHLLVEVGRGERGTNLRSLLHGGLGVGRPVAVER